MSLENLTIQTTLNGLKSKEFSGEELFNYYQKKITEKNGDLNAFLTEFDYETPLKGNLSGIPCAVKDNILIEGQRATGGSKILTNYIASYNATVIQKLKSQGVSFLGKTNCDEFAMGSSTENSAFGPTKNPHDLTRIPGGTSGGSAAAVAADLCVFALGSDTGGSIRQPAAMCGVVGIKPTYGRVSRHGLMAAASSLEQIGALAKNVYDTALVLETIAGQDRFDSTTVPKEVPEYTKDLDKSIKGKTIGVPKEFFNKGLGKEVEEKVRKSMDLLSNLGCEIKEISLPNFEYGLAAYYIINPSEISANMSRYDGVRYGHSSKTAQNLFDAYSESRAEGFGPEVKRRIMLGTYALSAGYYDAYYLKAQKVRALIKKDFDQAFEKVDAIVGPVAPTTAFKIGEKTSDPLALYLEDIYTVPVNLAGIPALSLPCGKDSKGLPIGFQIIGNMFEEGKIFNIAYNLEKELL